MRTRCVLTMCAVLLLASCRRDMQDTPRARTFQESKFFDDRMSARPLPAGTVSQDYGSYDELLETGKIGQRVSEVFPFEITAEVFARGRERFNIFCAPCHGRTGDGDGMVVRRGFRRPPSYHIERLRNAPAGHFFDVITNGYGSMYSYADRVPVRDRWAIAAYIRALQLSQGATIADVPADKRAELTGGGPQ
ncbi:MAG TPA: cytochrome c [Bryobacteraceae bacterium]|nr:cytochrome c [Bryobacteraceae bacterium]HOL71607.1 cytochrome c [Bryobacteraceae bacterium]HOQ44421.1 cytochrome c [Bryobacteraceae bacterium]HPQ16996.1 cytochrome c [Bryobacteraceae bacterium]HPU70740.1 cytochrome c [Bryobacteraceae bacterium]